MNKDTAFGILGIEKGFKPGLVQKKVWVTRNGKVHQTTVWVREGDETSKADQSKNVPVGGSIADDINGMNIQRYSDKAILVAGNTYANKSTLQEVKKDIGVGAYNGKLKGWVFPVKFLSAVLGGVISRTKDPDKIDALTNQKNSLPVGTSVNVGGEEGKITEQVSDEGGIKYNVKTTEGDLNGVNEKVIDVPAETDDKKIKEIINNADANNRAATTKQLFGIKSIPDIHKYSLSQYMAMHGIDQNEIDAAIKSLTTPKESTGSSSTGSSSPKGAPSVGKTEGLTKQQLIKKLVYAHYQAVSKAVNGGEKMKDSVLATYPDLKDAYNKKRQAMSEETKRKISEALTKNKPEPEPEKKGADGLTDAERQKREEAKERLGFGGMTDAEVKAKMDQWRKEAQEKVAKKKALEERRAQQAITGMSDAEVEGIASAFKTTTSKKAKEEQAKLAGMVEKIESVGNKVKELWEEERKAEDYEKRSKLGEERSLLSRQNEERSLLKQGQVNIVKALQNGGSVTEVTDAVGINHTNVADFSGVPSGDIVYDIETIINDEKPNYIPEIDRKNFRRMGFIFDSIRVGPNKYMVSTNGYRENGLSMERIRGMEKSLPPYSPDEPAYVMLTLDQLVLTQDYYTTLEQADMIAERDRKNQRALDHWDGLPDKTKERYLMQKYAYNGLPAKVRKQIPKEQFEGMSWQEREKIHKPVKRHGLKRLKAKFDDRHMANSFHSMYERFVDPNAKRTTKKGEILNRGQSTFGTSYAHSDAFGSWRDFRDMLDWKINDLKVQREEISGIRLIAMETSYGKSNTNDMLKKEDGILVKRQNGSDIKPDHIEQIKTAWSSVQGAFGPLKKMADKDNLVVSHAGNTFMYASKAMGVYVPSMGAIGVTAKFGEQSLGFTLGHEVAHYIDNSLGKTQGSRFASDNYESTAGKLAIAFRGGMNSKSDSKYTNSSHECFARALEQYHAIESFGDKATLGGDTGSTYFSSKDYASRTTYEGTIKPMVQKFLEENKGILKSLKWGDNLDIKRSFTTLLG
tara:strand:- start:98085 stop:101165 length:3081 start_codon:yes stop_codon:yes gene_type:complete